VAVYPRVRKTLTSGTRQRGTVRVRAEANFPAREAEARERGRDRVGDGRSVKPHVTDRQRRPEGLRHIQKSLVFSR
jgi:hypothetical protein